MNGFLVSAPNSGSGKTVITLALMRVLKDKGVDIPPAKAGPDFIDPAFHFAATGVKSFNLDCWAMRPDLISLVAAHFSKGMKTLIVEGMMGLFDGAADGSGSSAALANMLGLPVIFVVDCAHQSHSIAPLVKGFESFMPQLQMAGVILNKVGSTRHETMLRDALAPLSMPVLGSVYRNNDLKLPSRHLGLVQPSELADIETFVENAAHTIAKSVDLDHVIKISTRVDHKTYVGETTGIAPIGQHIAVTRDNAFRFAYPHLLDGWRRMGAEISFFSPLADEKPVPKADAIYLCGGYPELFAEKLSQALNFKQAMTSMAAKGICIYGECGGYMTLGESIEDANGQIYPMLGLLPLKTSFKQKKLHLGYRYIVPNEKSIFNQALRGHEFHYASIISEGNEFSQPLFYVRDALNNPLGSVGLKIGNVSGSFMHVIDIDRQI